MNQIPLKKAIFFIVLSTLLISGSATFAFLYYLHYQAQHKNDPKFIIRAIVQSRTDGPAIHNRYFMEMLNLSSDHPINLYQLKAKEAKRQLRKSSIIRSVNVKKILPHTLYITYSSRKPIAYLLDNTNTAIDEQGFLFPYKPYFHEQTLPKVYLGLEDIHWGPPSNNKSINLAIHLIELFEEQFPGKLKLIDVSNAFALSKGKRQVIALVDEHYLRLRSEDYNTQLSEYKLLVGKIGDAPTKVIDFRIPQLAYLLAKELS